MTKEELKPYFALMRLDKPVGTLLLWFPTAWALWLANQGLPPLPLLFWFALGTLLMRSAGCVVNDIADRHIDLHVSRTQFRPLTSGQLTLSQAILTLILLLVLSLFVLLQLPAVCVPYAILALIIALIYPFCKRFIEAPQLVLGLAFSMGIPMAYVASDMSFDWVTGLIFLLNFLWIVAYDTMYAMADKADDLKIGVKSTAIYFGDSDRLIISLLLLSLHFFWLIWALSFRPGQIFYWSWVSGLLLIMIQLALVYTRDPSKCFKAFKLSIWYGLMMWVGLM